LKEEWLAYSGDGRTEAIAERESGHQYELAKVEPIQTVPALPPIEKKRDKAPEKMEAPTLKTEPPVVFQPAVRTPPDLAEVVGLKPKNETVIAAIPEEKANVVVEQRPNSNRAPPAVVVPTTRTPAIEIERKPVPQEFSEILVDQLPVLNEKIATLSKPIGDLAKQFDPRNEALQQHPVSGKGERAQPDVWQLGAVESESQLQWLWNRGRQAFWEGDYEGAVESYRSLLEEDTKNADAWGELGNIYYAKKDWVRAVRAFGRAAAALIEGGKVDEANKIIRIIRSIDPQLADKLEADLS
jgi:tetratricopeptide (TPR) repeat protein